jgi:hypothetical protein
MDILVAIIMISIAVYIMYLSIKKINTQCTNTIEYRYLPRTLKEEQLEPVPINDIFGKLFDNQEPHYTSSGVY